MPGRDRPRIVLGQDITFPPYAFLSTPKDGAEVYFSLTRVPRLSSDRHAGCEVTLAQERAHAHQIGGLE